jgi:hypothetical protein
MEFRYKAIQVKQTDSNKMMVLFAAPATEIDQWAGIPQKKRFGTEETIGFQREENISRVKSLGEFCENNENIIQNPLLCATRKISIASTRFEAAQGETDDVQRGLLVIEIPEYNTFSMEDILGFLREYIEKRVPALEGKQPDRKILSDLMIKANQAGHSSFNEVNSESVEDNEDSENETEIESESLVESALFEESHIYDFWNEIAGRHILIKKMDKDDRPKDEFLDFKRDALMTYLRSVVLVDGQHRLRGAIEAAESRMEQDDILKEIERRIGNAEDPAAIDSDILAREVRRLPVSLLLSDDPSEQVFQFVVVNQKATPIGRALLGTIVSTTLSTEEIEKVALRLKNAGIQLEESQAITFLSRYEGSPFYNLVERGLSGDSKDLMQWNVLSSLVRIFRHLKGGKLYGSKNDYADLWKSRYLGSSSIVKNNPSASEDPYLVWSKLDGPWRDVFIAFYSEVRNFFGSTSDSQAHNYWGSPRHSNLFNKISLTILSADFFQFLIASKQEINSKEHVSQIIKEWLDQVSPTYFNRDWNLSGVKKDNSGIRNQWAFQWLEYRKNPVKLPHVSSYRKSKSVE